MDIRSVPNFIEFKKSENKGNVGHISPCFGKIMISVISTITRFYQFLGEKFAREFGEGMDLAGHGEFL
jgi:hypothetical protein